jgi:hypothetical protein
MGSGREEGREGYGNDASDTIGAADLRRGCICDEHGGLFEKTKTKNNCATRGAGGEGWWANDRVQSIPPKMSVTRGPEVGDGGVSLTTETRRWT